MDNKVKDIENRQNDYQQIMNAILRTELGIRSISIMYDEHSSDKKSKENIFLLKENIQYRLFSASHQYLIFLRELAYSEKYLEGLHTENPNFLNSFLLGNPHFDKVELELSSVFDSIIFQLSSVFDYLSHLLCYICKKDKSNTLYWTKLASSVRDKNNELYKLPIAKTIYQIDNDFVGRLYDYRSRLLHNKRDRHQFTSLVTLKSSDLGYNVKILSSHIAMKHFKTIRILIPYDKITLTYLSSWLLKESLSHIEKILDGLREEILRTSTFYDNVRKPKENTGFMLLMHDPITNTVKPVSDTLWEEYKNQVD